MFISKKRIGNGHFILCLEDRSAALHLRCVLPFLLGLAESRGFAVLFPCDIATPSSLLRLQLSSRVAHIFPNAFLDNFNVHIFFLSLSKEQNNSYKTLRVAAKLDRDYIMQNA
jgi:hypothetical protein